MVNFGPLTAEIGSGVWGTPATFNATFNGFRVLAALLHGSQVVSVTQTCGVEQRAPPMLGRTTITLGIGPHFLVHNISAECKICKDVKVLLVLFTG